MLEDLGGLDGYASVAADILVDRYIPLWGCPFSLLSDNSLQLCSEFSRALYVHRGIIKPTKSSYHACNNGGVARVNQMMALMLAMVGDEEETNSDLQIPNVESAYNNSVSAATGLTPNEIHMGHLPRLHRLLSPNPWRTSKRQPGPVSLHRPRYCPPTTRLPRRPGTSRHNRIASQPPQRRIDEALYRSSPFATGGWAWIYNSAATFHQGAKKGNDATRSHDKALLKLDKPLQTSRRRPGNGLRLPR